MTSLAIVSAIRVRIRATIQNRVAFFHIGVKRRQAAQHKQINQQVEIAPDKGRLSHLTRPKQANSGRLAQVIEY